MHSKREKLLITVKSAPVLSRTHIELVCIAGLREEGTWVRVHPIPFRTRSEYKQFEKFSWVECELTKNRKDRRPESFRLVDIQSIKTIGHVGTEQNWYKRRQFILENVKVYNCLTELKKDKDDMDTSLAVFKPTEVTKFEKEESDANWDPCLLKEIQGNLKQLDFFEDNSWRSSFKIVEKIPYDFYYEFKDVNGNESRMRILDWEIVMLYRNCLERYGGDKEVTLEKVYEKYFTDFTEKDLHFFLGTTLQYHSVAPNPFTIVGVFPIPHKEAGLPGFD